MKQKSKVHWLQCGDGNNGYVHATLKSRSASAMTMLVDQMGNKLVDEDDIKTGVVQFYKSLLGTAATTARAIDVEIIRGGPVLSGPQRAALVQPVSAQEIKAALDSIGDNKAPGPDGFSAKFYMAAWDIIGVEVTLAIQDFFRTWRLLKSVNTTIITLIPKSKTATTIRDYRPIACCNVLYKIISKVISNRMSNVISWLVGDEKFAFVPGRYIHDNTILAQEIIRGYGRQNISARCMIKMDLQKAYDSIKWAFVDQLLRHLGFPNLFVR